MSQIELETEFERIHLEEGPCRPKDESGSTKCDCKKIIAKPSEPSHTGSSLKVKERKKNLIKPARLKMIGSCYARNSRTSFHEENSNDETQPTTLPEAPDVDLDDFASEAFLKMRINSQGVQSQSPSSPSEDKDDRTSSASQPNSCSAQAKLQQQFSASSEFDSTIDEMSEFLAYHLNLYPQDKNYLVNSMYT